MAKGLGPIYRLESYDVHKKQYALVPRFGPRFASAYPETLYAEQKDIDPLLKEAGYVPGDVPVSEPFLVEVKDVEHNVIKKLQRFES